MEKIHTKAVSTGIQKTKKEVYVFKCCLGSNLTTPWRKQKTVKNKTDKEARQLYSEWMQEQEQAYRAVHEPVVHAKALQKVSSSPTFKDYTSQGDIPANDGQFFTQLKQEVSLSGSAVSHKQVGSLQSVDTQYRSRIRVVDRDFLAFANRPIDSITPECVDKLLDDIKATRGVSNNTLNHYLHAISKIFRLAQSAHVVPKGFNPCRQVDGRQKEYREKTVITASQYDRVLEAIEQLPPMFKAGMLVTLLCGLRREEVMGLMWTDIDLEHATLHVRHTLIWYHDETGKRVRTVKKGTKNGTHRIVGIPDKLVEALREYRATLPKRLSLWPDQATGTRYPMVWLRPSDGGIYDMDVFGHCWRQMRPKLLAQGVLTKNSRYHDLRGGFISYMLNKQHVSPVIVAKLAGHRSAQMTLDIYGDADSADINNALALMNAGLKD